LLRVEGKPNALFREAREVPLGRFAVETLREYLRAVDEAGGPKSDVLLRVGGSSGPADLRPGDVGALVTCMGLREAFPFAVRTLRHSLRTALHEGGAPFASVNEAFGHVTVEESAWHRLSGLCIGTAQGEFRRHAEAAVERLLA